MLVGFGLRGNRVVEEAKIETVGQLVDSVDVAA